MSQTTPLLDLPLIQEAQAQKHVTHNEAVVALDALVQPVALDMDRTEPPAAPREGDRHLVAPGATGGWAGRDGQLALFSNGGWTFLAPRAGWRMHVAAEGAERAFDGAAWGPVPVPVLGINAEASATNRLAVSAPATLLTHEGAGHRVVVNKAAPADTASLLFQSGWSGRAEMGLAGGDGFSVKVSADGAAWTTALQIDAATGHAAGAAVQQAPEDATPGRLMRADWGYGPGTLLGAVGLAGGLPTGAVLERGDTAAGGYLKLADGTLLCAGEVELGYDAPDRLVARWTFPAAFAATPPGLGAVLDADSVAAGCTPAIDHMGATTLSAPDATGVTLAQHRVSGLTDFAPGDTARLRVTATGRWA